jgi:hypothetical protein
MVCTYTAGLEEAGVVAAIRIVEEPLQLLLIHSRKHISSKKIK